MIRPDLEALLDLQAVDLTIDQVRHRRQTLPERAEIKAIDLEVGDLETDMDVAVEQRDAIAGREEAVETELVATEERGAAVSRRLYGGEVSASRELQAMAADIEALKVRSSALEDQALELLEQREPLDARIGSISAQVAGLAARREDATARLRQSEEKADEELAALAERRESAAGSVPADLVATYERLRSRLGGIGAARLVGNHCDGCHLTLSAVELDHIRHLPPGEVATCEQCSRILVPSVPTS